MRSVVDASGKAVDARSLIIEGSYYSLNKGQVRNLANEIVDFFTEKFGSKCVFDWGKGIKDIKENIDKHINDNYYSVSLRAYKQSDLIYNKTSLRGYERKVKYPGFGISLLGENGSVDYNDYCGNELVEGFKNADRYVNFILKLFNQEGKIPYCETIGPDLFFHMSSNSRIKHNEPDIMDGTIIINYKFYSFNDEIDWLYNENVELFKRILCKYQNINLCFQANRLNNLYSRYYGYYPVDDRNELRRSPVWDHIFQLYNREVGFAHFISKATRKLGIYDIPSDSASRITKEEMSGGGVVIRTVVPISQISINDHKIIKKCIYNTVLPRRHVFPFDASPRNFWEMIPVFEDELAVATGGLQFVHHGVIDIDYLNYTYSNN